MRAFSLIFDKFKAIFTNLIPYIIILISNTTTAVLLYRLSKKNLERLEIPTINLPRLIHHERPNISLSENWHSQSVSKPCASSKPCSSLNPKNTDRSVIMPIKSDSNSIYSQSKEIIKINHRYVEVDTSLNNYTHLAGKKAHVCLHSIWPKDKKNGYFIKVPHFSRYKLEDSDDEEIEEVSYTQPFQTKPNLTSDSFARPPLHRSRISNHPDGSGNLFEGDISSFKDSPSEYNFGREENVYLIKRHKNGIISRGKGSRWVLGENMNSTKIDVQPKISPPNLMSPSLLFNNLENSFTRTVYFPIQMNDHGFDANERKKSVRFSGEIMNVSGNEAKLLFNIMRNDNNDTNEVRDLVDDTSINTITNSLLPDYSIFQYIPYPLPSFMSTDAYNINPNSLCPNYRGFRPSWGPGNMLGLPASVVRGRNAKQSSRHNRSTGYPPCDDLEDFIHPPVALDLWVDRHKNEINERGCLSLFDEDDYQVKVLVYGVGEHIGRNNAADIFAWQYLGSCDFTSTTIIKSTQEKGRSYRPRGTSYTAINQPNALTLHIVIDPRKKS
ncbi:unnamed protein product [Gordionus sp. m RMFG-2023]